MKAFKKTFTLIFFLFCSILLSTSSSLVFSQQTKPNFVIVIGDDVGWDAFSITQSKFSHTPNLEGLAKKSLQFNRFYGTVAQCSPIRSELYTGLFPINNGVVANNLKRLNVGNIKSMGDHLRKLGYRVGLTGKSHFSIGGKFDKIGGFPTGANTSTSPKNQHDFRQVKQYIQETLDANENFCVVIGSIHAHHPWDFGNETNFLKKELKLPPHWIDTPKSREALARHSAEVEVLDQQVGEAQAMLKDMQLDKETIFIFLSEQGIAMPRAKWTINEHGCRSLALFSYPGKFPLGKTTNAIAQYCDVLPTLIDFAGGTAPELDGKSLKPVLLGNAKEHRDFAYLANMDPVWQRAIVTEKWKLIWNPEREKSHVWRNFIGKGKFFAEAWTEWLEAAAKDPIAKAKVDNALLPSEYELYDIVNDPYETVNLATQEKHATRVNELKTNLLQFMSNLGDKNPWKN